jgi:hypothetical protein
MTTQTPSTQVYTAEVAHAAAERGARWMDEHCPDWASKIDLDELRMSETDLCILGQTARCVLPDNARPHYGEFEYWAVVRHFAPEFAHTTWAAERGFDIDDKYEPIGDDSGTAEYEMLTIAWHEQIRQRLEAKP